MSQSLSSCPFPFLFVNHSLVSCSHPFGSRGDRSFLPRFKCCIYKLWLFSHLSCVHIFQTLFLVEGRGLLTPDRRVWGTALSVKKKTSPWRMSFYSHEHTHRSACLDCRDHNSFPLQPSASTLLSCLVVVGLLFLLQAMLVILFSVLLYFSFPAEELLNSRLCFLLFLFRPVPFTNPRHALQEVEQGLTELCSFLCTPSPWILAFSKPFWWSGEQHQRL